MPNRSTAAQRLALLPQQPHPISDMGRPQVLDQGLAGFVLQLLVGGGSDLEGKSFRPGLQPARIFRHDAEHNLTHDLSLSFQLHPWRIRADASVPWLTGNRPWADILACGRRAGWQRTSPAGRRRL